MKRYLAIPLLGGISALAFVGGWYLAVGTVLAATPPRTLFAITPPSNQVTLTIHSGTQTYTVHANWQSLVWDNGLVGLEYTSDRIFCDAFQPSNCAQVKP